jgi:hypothetical protein
MVSSFYSSNEAKQRKYIKQNRLRELNQEAQQEIVDEQIDAELGLESKTTKLSNLAKRVVNQLGSELIPLNQDETKNQLSAFDILTLAIKNQKLTELFQDIKKIPNNLLTEGEASDVKLLKSPEVKKQFNNELTAVIEKKGVPTATDITKIAKKSGINFLEELTKKAKERADKLEANPLDMSEVKPAVKKKNPFQEELEAKLESRKVGRPKNDNLDQSRFEKLTNLLELSKTKPLNKSEKKQISNLKTQLRSSGFTNDQFNLNV